MDKSKDVEELSKWTPEAELLLKEWSEKASCYRWLNDRCEKIYRRRYYCFSIPVIVLSTLTGTANFGMSSYVSPEGESTAKAIVGGLNLLAGLLSTLQTFLKIVEKMENHRQSGISWSKLGRSIQIELALDHKRRSPCHDFLNIARAEYDRLIEQSPLINDMVIQDFKKRFVNYNVSKPSITNGLDTCIIYKVENERDKRLTPPQTEEEELEEIVVKTTP